MKHFSRNLIAAALLAVFGLAAAVAQAPASTANPAQAEASQMRHDRMGKRDPARMMERIAKRQARIKEKLQITPAQEGAWNAWTAAMLPPADWKRPDRAEFAGLSTPERIDRMRALRAERNAFMDERGEATKTFYSALSTEQKQVFDTQLSRGGHRGGHRGHHGHEGHRS